MQQRGFTLIELLATIAILALLIGIMIPAISGARSAGHNAVCASNVRQVQLANDLYAHDHGERCLTGAADFTGSNLHRWHGIRPSDDVSFQSESGDITPYLGGSAVSRRVRGCPSFVGTIEDLCTREKGFESGSGGYGYNRAYMGVERTQLSSGYWTIVDDTKGALRTIFASPSATVAFADAALAENELIEYSFVQPRKWPHTRRGRPDPSVHFRHAGRSNVAWLDGHVSSEQRTHTWKSGVYTEDPAPLGIGWFGAHDDNRLFDYD